jgi:hypothetical protein
MTRREPRFTPVATLGPGIPLGIYYALGRRSREILDKLRRDLMERLLKVASPMGLLRRGVRRSRRAGTSANFPQAFSHLALIDAAARIIVAERLVEL